MELSINAPALLFPAIAILTLGYVNRFISATSVVRNFKKDYDSGYVHNDIVVQLKIMKKRINLLRDMIGIAITALILACISMFCIFLGYHVLGDFVFGLSVICMIVSMAYSLYETSLSNRSLKLEIDDILASEAKKYKS